MDTFSINKSTQIILYGAASSGLLFAQRLTEAGYNVSAFIDKRADEICEFIGKRVYSLAQLDLLLKEFPESVVILSVKNVFEHSQITEYLVKNGCHRIIYRPYSVLNGSKDDVFNQLNNAYTATENQKYELLVNLPYSYGKFDYDFKDYAIIKKGKSNIIAFVPVEIIYSYDIDEKWGCLPMTAFYPHVNFYNTLYGKDKNIEDYLSFCIYSAKKQGDIKITDNWKKNVIKNRVQSFEHMNLSLDIDPDFFIRNAPTAKWNEKKCVFNLTSGKHRTTFLISRGHKFIALSISMAGYSKWLDCKLYNEQINKLLYDPVPELSLFIAHPKLYKYPYAGESIIRRFFIRILTDMAKKSIDSDGVPIFKDKSVCCIGDFAQYFGVYLEIAGFERCDYNISDSRNMEKEEKYNFVIICGDYYKVRKKVNGDNFYIITFYNEDNNHKLLDSGFYKENRLYLFVLR